jgi:regulator of protease activity HflC (stomatin/prohibitin superfamily)
VKTHISQGPQAAPRPELFSGLLFLAIAIGLVGAPLYWTGLALYFRKLALGISAPALILAGAFLSAYFTARVKERGPCPVYRFNRSGAQSLIRPLEVLRTIFDRARANIANTDWLGDWLPSVLVTLASVGAFYLTYRAWTFVGVNPNGRLDQWLLGSLLGLCFPVLVVERRFASFPERSVSESPALCMLLRALLLNLLAFALSYLLLWQALPYAELLQRAALLLTDLIAAELLLRNTTFLFLPASPLELRRGRSESLLASLLRLQKPDFGTVGATMSRQFGIDLGRSWALQFIRRAALPSLAGLIIVGWLMTGVTSLDLSERSVYEVLGRPQGVLHSGLHVHLPWPIGQLMPVEYGAVREIPIVFPNETGSPVEGQASATPTTIEGVPPESADRLWDSSHPSEASYLVASNRNGRETFEVVNIDIQILYRIGLSDQAAYDALYSTDNPEALIRAAAGRMLARYFARYTIPDVLGQNREQFIQGFQRELQGRLDAAASGVDVLGVVIEAIHPPSDAAGSYQEVQAAGIRAETAVARARSQALTDINQAQQQATTMRDDATASGNEMINQAKTDTALFASDVTAYHNDGAAFLLERRLASVGKSIHPSTPATIVDANITPAQMPVIDFRPPGSQPITPDMSSPPPVGDDDDK